MKRLVHVALAIALLAGCQGVGGPTDARFQLPAGADSAVAGRVVVAVRFERSMATRGLQAVASDVFRVTVRLAGDAATHAEHLTHDMLLAGRTELTFGQLPGGAYDYLVTAHDARGYVLARAVGAVTVVAGQTTDVSAELALARRAGDAAAVPALLSPGPAGRGDLSAEIGFVRSAPLVVPPIAGQHALGAFGPDVTSVGLHPDGSVWFTAGAPYATFYEDQPAPPSFGKLLRLAPDGTIEDHTPTHAAGDPAAIATLTSVAVGGPGGRLFVPGDGPGGSFAAPGYVLGADGAPDPAYDFTSHLQGLLDPSGALWTYNHTSTTLPDLSLVRYDGVNGAPQVVETFTGAVRPVAIAVTGSGDVWSVSYDQDAADPQPLRLTRYSPAGAPMTSRVHGRATMERAYVADGAGRLWGMAGDTIDTIRIYGPDGDHERDVRIAIPFSRLRVAPNGEVWAFKAASIAVSGIDDFDEANDDQIARIAPDGHVLAYYHIGSDVHVTDLAVAADGTMWLGTLRSGLLEVKVDVPFAP